MLSGSGPQEACSRKRVAASGVTFGWSGPTGIAAGPESSPPGSGLMTVMAVAPPIEEATMTVAARRLGETSFVSNSVVPTLIRDVGIKPTPVILIDCDPNVRRAG